MISVEQIIRNQEYESISVTPNDKVAEVAAIMTDNHWVMVVVCSENGQLLGVVSRHDFIRALADVSGDISGLKVSQLLTKNPVTCSIEDDILDVLHLMEKHHFHHMPVIQHGNLVGPTRHSDIQMNLLEESDLNKRAALIAIMKYL